MAASSSSSDDQGVARKSLADFKLRGGHYQEAAEIYESILDNETRDFNLDEGKRVECVAGLVKALSYFDIDRAMEVAEDLDSAIGAEYDDDDDAAANTEPFDGEDLEAMEIPRLCKASGGSNRSRKILGSGRKMCVLCWFLLK